MARKDMVVMADIDTTASFADAARIAPRADLPAPTPHMCKAAKVFGNWAARAAGTGFATGALLPWRTDPQALPQLWFELWQMQASVWLRQYQMEENWLQGWFAWAQECSQARGANTMSRLVEQEFDLVGQWHDLLRGQATDVVSLLENLEVNYAYWVTEKVR
jgi:hypothetical protein